MEAVRVELFGQDPKIQKAVAQARNVSVTRAPVLIVGEAGTGKRTLGRYIHEHSNRADRPLEIVDCSSDSQDVENKILGFKDNTGKFHRGVLESANRGTVIFANVDCLDEEFQKRLHKILTELEDYDIDVRIVATTSKNLSKLVGAGRFYRGLYTILSGTTINLAPLRERHEDLVSLAKHFLSESTGVDETEVSIDQSAIDKLLNHYWAGNLKELRNVISNSNLDENSRTLNDQAIEIGERKISSSISDEDTDGMKLMSLRDAEKLLIKKALIHTSENRTQAAKILGVSIRTLRNKINEYRNEGASYFINLR